VSRIKRRYKVRFIASKRFWLWPWFRFRRASGTSLAIWSLELDWLWFYANLRHLRNKRP